MPDLSLPLQVLQDAAAAGGDTAIATSRGGIPVFVGILVGLVASFVQSLGLTIQRKSHLQNDSRPADQQRKAHRRPLWLLGFAIFISSNLFGTVFQIGALPIVILAPLGAVSLLWNALLSRILLGDLFSARTLAGTLLIAGGATLIAIFGVVPEQNHNLDELMALFRRPGFVAYITLMSVAVAAALVVVSQEGHVFGEQAYQSLTGLPLRRATSLRSAWLDDNAVFASWTRTSTRKTVSRYLRRGALASRIVAMTLTSAAEGQQRNPSLRLRNLCRTCLPAVPRRMRLAAWLLAKRFCRCYSGARSPTGNMSPFNCRLQLPLSTM